MPKRSPDHTPARKGHPRWVQSCARWYDTIVLGRPRLVVVAMLVALGFLAAGMRDFRIDASADTLVLEHDQDLLYGRTIEARYGTGDFVLLTYTPHGDLFADATLADLRALRDELAALEGVTSVVSILDVPLLRNPPVPIQELKANIKTLGSPDVDRALAAVEFRESPLFRDLLVSPDLRTTALQVNLVRDEAYDALQKRRTALRDIAHSGTATLAQRTALRRVTADYNRHKDAAARRRHQDIRTVRGIMDRHRDSAQLFLGGVPMIADDMITSIRRDLGMFGLGMLAFLVATLAVIFRRVRWVMLPMLCCLFSAVAMMGGLGLARWDVTVISSNFISLQLIITMALAIHLVVRYREVQAARPEADHPALVRETVHTIFMPCLYTSLTTIAGFCSLIVCDILPVIHFGWMMTMGIVVSLAVTFLFFPAALVLMRMPAPARRKPRGFAVTAFFARFTSRRPVVIFAGALLVTALTVLGISRLEVENSFINYFKDSTEIYQGMRFIDRELGGTTPLDVIIDFAGTSGTAAPAVEAGDEFDEFDEFDGAEDDAKYWYTPERMDDIRAVHAYLEGLPAVGKVLSVQTLLALADQLEGGGEWDSFELALLFNAFPAEFRQMLLDPYVSIEHNQARVSLRIKDSLEGLRRDALLKQIRRDLSADGVLKQGRVRLAGVMVLYNNMLQSLFHSQIRTIGFTVLAIMAMFVILFRSIKIALIAIFPNLVASLTVLGVMGLVGLPLDMMTITIVAISIGIAVDNTIHYIHRFRHEFETDRDYMQTMFRCHGSIGNAMYYTSITIIVGFSILALSDFIPSILFGLLTSLAMAMALLAALTLLPRIILLVKPFGPPAPGARGREKAAGRSGC